VKIYALINTNTPHIRPELFLELLDARNYFKAIVASGEPWVPCIGVDWDAEEGHYYDQAVRSVPLRQWNGLSGWQHSVATSVYVFEISVH
jgi:hypothetical protein